MWKTLFKQSWYLQPNDVPPVKMDCNIDPQLTDIDIFLFIYFFTSR